MRVNRAQAVGVTEPYHRLTEKPYHVPQWCSKHWLKAGERKGGGKRRRASCFGWLLDVIRGKAVAADPASR
jgi:hypothetical protein